MKHRLALTQCPEPPARRCQPGEWWRYEVGTASGINSASGYAPGPEANARRVAVAALNSLQRMEGIPITRFANQETPALKPKGTGHDVGTCNCRLCSNRRYKDRNFREAAAKKPRRALAQTIAADADRAAAKRTKRQ